MWGQVCYSIDLNEIKTEMKMIKRTLQYGLNFYLDYNEEKQTMMFQKDEFQRDTLFASHFVETNSEREAIIHISTLGK